MELLLVVPVAVAVISGVLVCYHSPTHRRHAHDVHVRHEREAQRAHIRRQMREAQERHERWLHEQRLAHRDRHAPDVGECSRIHPVHVARDPTSPRGHRA